jgi:hypothetical protein
VAALVVLLLVPILARALVTLDLLVGPWPIEQLLKLIE